MCETNLIFDSVINWYWKYKFSPSSSTEAHYKYLRYCILSSIKCEKNYIPNLIPNKKEFWEYVKCLIEYKPAVSNFICRTLT